MKKYFLENDIVACAPDGVAPPDVAIIDMNDISYEDYLSEPRKYEIRDFKLTDISDTPKYRAEQAQKEKERIQGLFMTKLDFVKAVAGLGITYAMIKEELAKNEAAQTAWDLCNNLYRNDSLVEQFLTQPPIKMTAAQIDALFDSVDKAKQQAG